jgi:hypothetical protein
MALFNPKRYDEARRSATQGLTALIVPSSPSGSLRGPSVTSSHTDEQLVPVAVWLETAN